MFRTLALAMLVSLLLVSVAPAADNPRSILSLNPGLAYKMMVPENRTLDVQVRAMGELGATYNIPVDLTGEHNIKVGGGGGVGQSFTNSGVKLGYAYAPKEIKTVLVGLVMTFDLTFPQDDLAALVAATNETWMTVGLEGSLDFTIPGGLPASLLCGGGWGLRQSPDQFYFALNLPVQPAQVSERIRSSE